MKLRSSYLPTTASLVDLRGKVRAGWPLDTDEGGTWASPSKISGYFIDRYAMGLHASMSGRALPRPARVPPHDSRSSYLSATVRPTAALGGWKPCPELEIETSPFYATLLAEWNEFVMDIDKNDVLPRLSDQSGRPWKTVLDHSVFYPGPPVFRGATFFDKLNADSRALIVERRGAAAPIDFFLFILQVHESIHFCQTGEPLLNEFVQACLWVAFLDNFPELWIFQGGRADDACFVREISLVQRHQWVEGAIAAQLDTAKMVDAQSKDGTYFTCCLAAYCFDHGAFSYASYLSFLSTLFDERRSRRMMLARYREMSTLADTVGVRTDLNWSTS